MQILSAVLVKLILCNIAAHGQIRSLYADPKAGRIGDALTVLIQENASATNQTSTSTGKNNAATVSSSVPVGGNLLEFVPLHALDSQFGNQYQGQGSTSRSARLTARVTVTVTGLKPNGDLIIEGVRSLKINGETEAIFLTGSVNPAMVKRDNTVPSSSIADLQIEYTGKGTITQGVRPGLVARFVNWVF